MGVNVLNVRFKEPTTRGHVSYNTTQRKVLSNTTEIDMQPTTEEQERRTVIVRRVLTYEVEMPDTQTDDDAIEAAHLMTTSQASDEYFTTADVADITSDKNVKKVVGMSEQGEHFPVRETNDLSIHDLVLFTENGHQGRVIDRSSRSIVIIDLMTGEKTSFVHSTGNVWGGDGTHISDAIVGIHE